MFAHLILPIFYRRISFGAKGFSRSTGSIRFGKWAHGAPLALVASTIRNGHRVTSGPQCERSGVAGVEAPRRRAVLDLSLSSQNAVGTAGGWIGSPRPRTDTPVQRARSGPPLQPSISAIMARISLRGDWRWVRGAMSGLARSRLYRRVQLKAAQLSSFGL